MLWWFSISLTSSSVVLKGKITVKYGKSNVTVFHKSKASENTGEMMCSLSYGVRVGYGSF